MSGLQFENAKNRNFGTKSNNWKCLKNLTILEVHKKEKKENKKLKKIKKIFKKKKKVEKIDKNLIFPQKN